MLAAAAKFVRLASQRAYDRDRMFYEAAETLRRLVWVEIQADRKDAVEQDLPAMGALVKNVKESGRLRVLTTGLDELRAIVSPTESEADHPPVWDTPRTTICAP
jgi:hypothetical protein